MASPDPQAFRPPDQAKNVLQVGLPTNFKAARFDAGRADRAAAGIGGRYRRGPLRCRRGPIEFPVKLKVHDSIFVPLAKWPMLIAGNYRCITPDGAIPIRDAVHGDIDKSKAVYEWVSQLCQKLGADPEDLVPFEKYAKAAEGLAQAVVGGPRAV